MRVRRRAGASLRLPLFCEWSGEDGEQRDLFVGGGCCIFFFNCHPVQLLLCLHPVRPAPPPPLPMFGCSALLSRCHLEGKCQRERETKREREMVREREERQRGRERGNEGERVILSLLSPNSFIPKATSVRLSISLLWITVYTLFFAYISASFTIHISALCKALIPKKPLLHICL